MSKAARYALNKNKYLLPDELHRLNQIIATFRETDFRNSLLLELALATGARAQELLNITRADLSASDQTILIHGLKGSNDREIPLAQALYNRINRLSEQVPGQRIFNVTYDRLYQIWDLYRPVPKKFHSLRHTFAIELYKKTKDIRLLQVALGHRNITNTMIYADYLYSKEELRRLIL
ncbi:MAG: integrase [Bdellovibrio sp.]|nr:MAG: integrase [Bdellovibrio sp.]